MNDVIYAALYFGITLGAFLLGKFVFPEVPQTVTDKLTELSKWAAKFVEWAKEFKKDKTGEEKMAAVVEQLKKIAEEAGLDVTEEQLKAIAQAAYNAMKAGEKEHETGVEATLTDDVPEGATETNADGTVNVYDAAGNIVGTIKEEEAEEMTKALLLSDAIRDTQNKPE